MFYGHEIAFYMGVDMLFVTIKNTMVKVFREANEKTRASEKARANGAGK